MNKENKIFTEDLVQRLSNYAGLRVDAAQEKVYMEELEEILSYLNNFAEADVPLQKNQNGICDLREDKICPGMEQNWLNDNSECRNGYVSTAHVWDKEK